MRPELRPTIDMPWLALEPIVVGDVPSRGGTPGSYVIVEDDEGSPVARIDVHDDRASRAFQEVIVWAGLVVIGFGGSVHLVSVRERTAKTTPLEGYFGHLYPLAEHLLVADASRLRCFDRSGSMLWCSDDLGIDGVIVSDVVDGTITGAGEWDPPGGWRPFVLRLSTGAPVPA